MSNYNDITRQLLERVNGMAGKVGNLERLEHRGEFFTDLRDAPSSFSGFASAVVYVGTAGTALAFGPFLPATTGTVVLTTTTQTLTNKTYFGGYYGGTASAGSAVIDSTNHATKGNIYINPSGGSVYIGGTAGGGGLFNIRNVPTPSYGFESQADGAGRGFQIVTQDYVNGATGSTMTVQFATPGTANVSSRIETWTAGKTAAGNLCINQQSTGFLGNRTLTPVSPFHTYENTSEVGTVAGVTIEQDGAGDAVVQYYLTSDTRWVEGIDNSDSNAFGWSAAADLANKIMRLSTAGVLDIKAGTSTGMEARVGGVLFKSVTQTGNVGSGEDVLLSYTVPANVLAVDLDSIRFRSWGSTANNGNAKTLKVRWGGTAGDIIFNTSLDTSTADEWVLNGEIYRTGAATGRGYAWAIHNDVQEVDDNLALAQTHSGAIDFVITGEGGSTNDILIEGCTIEFLPNNT